MTNLTDYIPATEAARLKGYANNTTYRTWARDGRIPGAVKLGRDWMLPRVWVDSQPQAEERGGPGGPRGVGVRGQQGNPKKKQAGARSELSAEEIAADDAKWKAMPFTARGVIFTDDCDDEEPPPEWGK